MVADTTERRVLPATEREGHRPLRNVSVLYVSHTGAWGGGAEVVLEQVIRATRRIGALPHLVAPRGPLTHRLEPLCDSITATGMPWFRRTPNPTVILGHLMRAFLADIDLYRAIRRTGSSLVHANSGVAALGAVIPAAAAGVPLIWHQHDIIPRRLTNRIVLKTCARFAARIIATSHSVADSLQALGISPELVEIVSPPVRPEFLQPRPDRASARETLGLPPDAFIVAIVGRMVPRKGHIVLLDAVAALAAEGMDIHCLVAGDEPKQGGVAEESADYTDQVRRRARSGPLQGRVTRLGHRDDIRPVLAASDVLAVPAFAEPFGIVVLEAFALGIPVVASATAGPRETISHGETGLLVPPGDAQQLARALKRVHDETDACEAMTERARLYVEGNFSEERLRTRLYDVYASVLGIDTSQVSSEPMAAVGQ